ncbi:hypothetical protein [Variovorax sp. NFACC27]
MQADPRVIDVYLGH